jgi:hypothetical protein
MTAASDEFAGQYATQAVESGVYDADREVVGHVGLLDLDDSALGEALEVARRTPGPSVVLRSSEWSHHVWSLAVDSLDSWIDRTLDLDAVDVDHVALSDCRGCGVIRLEPKISLETGDHVRPAPQVRRVVPTPTDLPVSQPHADLLRDEFDVELQLPERRVGASLDRRTLIADIGGRGGDR